MSPTTVKVSSRYQIVVPAAARAQLNIHSGDRLLVDIQDGLLILIPQPQDYTQKLTGLHKEVWEKVDDDTIVVDVWTYDPPVLLEPWYTQFTYRKLTNDDDFLRIRYWDFTESQNNAITLTEDGGSDFTDFDFTASDD